jgi:hypothetical protein
MVSGQRAGKHYTAIEVYDDEKLICSVEKMGGVVAVITPDSGSNKLLEEMAEFESPVEEAAVEVLDPDKKFVDVSEDYPPQIKIRRRKSE